MLNLGKINRLIKRFCQQAKSPVRLVLHNPIAQPLTLPFVRDILYNIAVAKKHQGQLKLIIQDLTPSSKLQQANNNSLNEFKQQLEWLGLLQQPELSIKRQSEMLVDVYPKYDKRLIASKNMYPCFCTQERLAQLSKYDGTCLAEANLTKQVLQAHVQNKTPFRMRFKVKSVLGRGRPKNSGQVRTIYDAVRGQMPVPKDLNEDDFVVRQAWGLPSTLMATLVDHYESGSTHFLNSISHFQTAVRMHRLYNTLNQTASQNSQPKAFPKIGFLPQISHKTLITIRELRENEYLPMSVLNYCMLDGWKPYGSGISAKLVQFKNELFSLSEFVEFFDIDKVIKETVKFDKPRLDKLNSHYFQTSFSIPQEEGPEKQQSLLEFRLRLKQLVSPQFCDKLTDQDVIRINKSVVKKLHKYSQMTNYLKPYYAPSVPDFTEDKVVMGYLQKIHNQPIEVASQDPNTAGSFQRISLTEANTQSKRNKKILQNMILIIDHILRDFTELGFAQKISEFLMNHKNQKIESQLVFGLLKVWLTGSHKTDNILHICKILGKKEVLRRLQQAMTVYQKLDVNFQQKIKANLA